MDGQPMGRFLEACGAAGPLELEVLDEAGGPVGRWSYAQPFAVVGRDPKADLTLEDDLVSSRHAFLQIIGGRVFVVDLGSRTGVRWGEEVRPAGWLLPGELIGIGPYQLRLIGPAAGDGMRLAWPNPMIVARMPVGSPLARITLTFPDVAPEPAQWRPRRVLALVGRSSRCHLRIPDEAVSLFHCALLRTRRGVWVVDLLSREGTRINGALTRSGPLADGDTLHVARYRVQVASDDGSRSSSGRPAAAQEPVEVEERLAASAERVALPPLPFPAPPLVETGLAPMTLPPLPSLRHSLTGHPPEQVAVIEAVVEPIIAQFGQMQQHMFEQFHQAMMMMFQMFSSMHRDQMNLVREELDQIRKLSGELDELRAKAEAAGPPASTAARPKAPVPTPFPPRVRRPAANGEPPRPAPEDHRPRPEAPRPAVPAASPDRAAGEVHDLLFQRMAKLQEERQTRWKKILSLVTGEGGTEVKR